MFKKILLPLDLTDKHEPVLNIAMELAKQSKGEILLLHVVEVIPGLLREEEQEFYTRLERAAQEHLRRFGQDLAQRQIPWRSEVVVGNRVRATADFASQQKVDLIIVLAPRLQPDHPAMGWGSLSWKVGLVAPCPVMLVK